MGEAGESAAVEVHTDEMRVIGILFGNADDFEQELLLFPIDFHHLADVPIALGDGVLDLAGDFIDPIEVVVSAAFGGPQQFAGFRQAVQVGFLRIVDEGLAGFLMDEAG